MGSDLSGYSGTPLVQKLGIKLGMKVAIIQAPYDYLSNEAKNLPEIVTAISNSDEGRFDFIQYFVSWEQDLKRDFPLLMKCIQKGGMIWISWPKKAAKMPGDLNGDIVREAGLGIGLVDVKVCAVNESWSGLKFVFRLKDRDNKIPRRIG